MDAVGQRLTLSEHWGSLPNIQHLLDLSHYSLLLPCRINVSNSSLQSTNLKSPQHLPLSPASSSLYTTNPHRDILTTSLPNHPDSLKCNVPHHLDKATDYPPITKSKDFSFPYSPLKCQLYFMLLTKLFLLPNPPHISTLLVFSHFQSYFLSPILNCIIPQVCTQSPTCSYSYLVSLHLPASDLHTSIHPKWNSSSSNFLMTFLTTVNVNTKILFHSELPLKDSFL